MLRKMRRIFFIALHSTLSHALPLDQPTTELRRELNTEPANGPVERLPEPLPQHRSPPPVCSNRVVSWFSPSIAPSPSLIPHSRSLPFTLPSPIALWTLRLCRSLYLLPHPIAARTAATSRSLPPHASADRSVDFSLNRDRFYQSAPTGLLAGSRCRSPTLPESSLTPDRCHSLCLLRSLPQRVVTADRFTSCHNRSLHGLRQPADRFHLLPQSIARWTFRRKPIACNHECKTLCGAS
ncbi:MAG: hypothetical protein HC769_35480 [Cyanobacteria bacterium CRU_2_1]|nr:hypothetical protein [Cyanobacteria bacterium CRU_2_1]